MIQDSIPLPAYKTYGSLLLLGSIEKVFNLYSRIRIAADVVLGHMELGALP